MSTVLYTPAEKIIVGTLVYTLDISLIIGNLLVIVAFLNDRQLQITRNYYIFNLAIADLIIGLFVIPVYSSTIWANDWKLSREFCVVWTIINQTAVINSHAAIFLITFDRYRLVQNAMYYTANETTRKARKRVLIAWTVTAIFNVGFVIFGEWYYSQDQDTNMASCSPHTTIEVPYFVGLKYYDVIVTLSATIITIILPLLALIVLNKKVYTIIRNRVRKTSALNILIHKSLPSAHVIANVNIENNPPKSPKAPILNIFGKEDTERYPQIGKQLALRSVGSISQVPTLETIQEEQEKELQQMRAKVVQWLDDIPTDEVFAISGVYADDGSTATSKDNLDSAAIQTQETEIFESDSIFEIKASNAKTISQGLRPSLSSLSSISSIPLGEEAAYNENDESKENKLKLNIPDKPKTVSASKEQKRNIFITGHLWPQQNKSETKTAPSRLQKGQTEVSPVPCIRKEQLNVRINNCVTRRNSVKSVAVLAKYKVKQDRKAALTITLLITLFIIFKIPYAIALLGNAIRNDFWVSVQAFEAVTWLYWLKSVTNPFVYAFISKRFRAYCIKIFDRMKVVFMRIHPSIWLAMK